MLAQLSARLMASRAAGMQPGGDGLGVQVQGGGGGSGDGGGGPEGEVARLVLGDECRVM